MSEKPRRWWHRLFGRRAQPRTGQDSPAEPATDSATAGDGSSAGDGTSSSLPPADGNQPDVSPGAPGPTVDTPAPDVGSHTGPATSDVTIRCTVEPDRHEDFDEWMAPLVATAVDAPGFASAALVCQRDEDFGWRLTFRFTTPEHRRSYMSGDAYIRAFEWVPDIFRQRPEADLSEDLADVQGPAGSNVGSGPGSVVPRT